ncbi:hypothetical protein CSV71_15095 [Sporosarcina sp. P21c]|uniref:hypothetical protein n=1 Tax=Sporosarcina TaxID=1569 RepID=UPI000A14A455|nr:MULTISPECIES: hypothetical protein [Sporosarcina]ARJ39203.1 hypothetical protein SporoP8_10185 [Sporosarcina ureae]PIC66054.1 hypothetical protein CSV78_14380 [Sporosarcina sp. P16a]PIC82498.1 hypothetical protein CSV73_11765 [Sporosarcina sp. P1]PIC88370.1 hypothetical protein CSV71_15095 [Sporosarcina sp. P21c]PIC91656.1 hypothetical protein CSV70_14365 [Sporosarcina sp. P25]
MASRKNPSPNYHPNTYRLIQTHPENLQTNTVSLFDLHEDMQTVDSISLPDQRKALMKEKINHSPRFSGGSLSNDYGAPH